MIKNIELVAQKRLEIKSVKLCVNLCAKARTYAVLCYKLSVNKATVIHIFTLSHLQSTVISEKIARKILHAKCGLLYKMNSKKACNLNDYKLSFWSDCLKTQQNKP